MYIVAKDPISGVIVKTARQGSPPNGVKGNSSRRSRTTRSSPSKTRTRILRRRTRAALDAVPLRLLHHERELHPVVRRCGDRRELDVQHHDRVPAAAPCPGPTLPFSPSLASGTTNNNAGGFSPLTRRSAAKTGSRACRTWCCTTRPGVSGILAGVPLCPEAQANAGTCGPESQIGETTVSVGLGGDPFSVTGGKVYLTEKYAGAPLGLSIVNPAKAGPFDLQEGKPAEPGSVVVRAKIEIDPITAALTVTTDPPGRRFRRSSTASRCRSST